MYIGDNDRIRYRTGEIWSRAFVGVPGQAKAVLSIKSSRFTWEVVALGFASRYTYVAEATLTTPQKTVSFKSEGSSTSAFPTEKNYREAVQSAVEAMVKQAKEALTSLAPAGENQVPRSVFDRLRELEKLRQDGLITDDEYQRKKTSILEAL